MSDACQRLRDVTAGAENFRHTLRQSARINWHWWAERTAYVLSAPLIALMLWFVLVAWG